MGLLDKLFSGSTDAEKAAKDLLSGLVNSAKEAVEKEEAKEQAQPYQEPQPQAADEYAADGPSGDSWGPKMPDEPNQYNYGGTFEEYFEDIFGKEFAQYRVDKESTYYGKRILYTFYDGGRKALVVELLTSSSGSKKLRDRCRAEGTPYLRFYYDYDGWWNTRSYVTRRVTAALNGTL